MLNNSNRFPGNKIDPTAWIGPNVTMGTGNEIGPYCVIGAPGEHRRLWGKDKGVWIGSNNRITGLVTIDSGIEGQTVIGDECFIMKHAHIGHDAVIQSRVTVSCGALIGGHTVIMEKANIGLNATIHQKHRIGKCVMIGMGAVVPLKVEVPDETVFAGNPARYLRQNVAR